MTRISLVYVSFGGQLDASVEDSDFVGPCAALPDAPTNLELEMFGEFLLVVIQVGVSAKRREVVTMDDSTDVAGLTVEAARRGCTGCVTNSFKSAAIAQFSFVTGVTAAVGTSHQTAHKIWGKT